MLLTHYDSDRYACVCFHSPPALEQAAHHQEAHIVLRVN
jgi:hypothetical protein